MRLDDSNKISLDYITYILAAIYKISLNDIQCQKTKCSKYFGTEEVKPYTKNKNYQLKKEIKISGNFMRIIY